MVKKIQSSSCARALEFVKRNLPSADTLFATAAVAAGYFSGPGAVLGVAIAYAGHKFKEYISPIPAPAAKPRPGSASLSASAPSTYRYLDEEVQRKVDEFKQRIDKLKPEDRQEFSDLFIEIHQYQKSLPKDRETSADDYLVVNELHTLLAFKESKALSFTQREQAVSSSAASTSSAAPAVSSSPIPPIGLVPDPSSEEEEEKGPSTLPLRGRGRGRGASMSVQGGRGAASTATHASVSIRGGRGGTSAASHERISAAATTALRIEPVPSPASAAAPLLSARPVSASPVLQNDTQPTEKAQEEAIQILVVTLRLRLDTLKNVQDPHMLNAYKYQLLIIRMHLIPQQQQHLLDPLENEIERLIAGAATQSFMPPLEFPTKETQARVIRLHEKMRQMNPFEPESCAQMRRFILEHQDSVQEGQKQFFNPLLMNSPPVNEEEIERPPNPLPAAQVTSSSSASMMPPVVITPVPLEQPSAVSSRASSAGSASLAPSAITSARRESFSYGRHNQFNVYDQGALRGVPRDRSSCTFCDYSFADAFLKNPRMLLNLSFRSQQIDELIVKGARAKDAFKRAKKIDKKFIQQNPNFLNKKGEPVDNFHTTHEEVIPSFTSLEMVPQLNFVLGQETFEALVDNLIRSARKNGNLAVAAVTRGPASFAIAVDLSKDQERFYLFDSHGQADPSGERTTGGYIYEAHTRDELLSKLWDLQPPLEGDGQVDWYNTCDSVFLQLRDL